MYLNDNIKELKSQGDILFNKSNKKNKWKDRRQDAILVGESYSRILDQESFEFDKKWTVNKMAQVEKDELEYNKSFADYKDEILLFYQNAELEYYKEAMFLNKDSTDPTVYKNSLVKWHIEKGYKPYPPKKSKLLLEYEKDNKRLSSLYSKYKRVSDCSTFLAFGKNPTSDDMKLLFANFCRARLCPMCSWRKSLQIFAEVSQVMDLVESEHDLRYSFLTLTVRNCLGEDLSKTMDKMFKAFNRMTRRLAFKKAVKGYFRAFEVTYNRERDDFHPHFHVILGVNKSYFTDSRRYLSQKKWIQLWKEALGVDYNPMVDIRTLKDKNELRKEINDKKNNENVKHNVVLSLMDDNNNNNDEPMSFGSAIAEVAKYTVKSEDYLIKDEKGNVVEDLTDEIINILDEALMYRRLHSYGFLFDDARKRIKQLQEVEEIEEKAVLREDVGYMLMFYNWNYGAGNYVFDKKQSERLTEEITSKEGLDVKKFMRYENTATENKKIKDIFEKLYTPIHKKK